MGEVLLTLEEREAMQCVFADVVLTPLHQGKQAPKRGTEAWREKAGERKSEALGQGRSMKSPPL